MDTSGWEQVDPIPTLNLGEAHLWRGKIPNQMDRLTEYFLILSDEEISRARSYQFERDQICFAYCRYALRDLLGKYLLKNPASLEFQLNEFGKPSLQEPIQFNISHSHGWALFFFSKEGPLGVDLEKIQTQKSGEDLAKRFFSEEELKFLKSFDKEERPQAFFRLWTLKEAFIKAVGNGLSYPLNSFSIGWDLQGNVQCASSQAQGILGKLNLASFSPAPGFQGALANPKSIKKIRRLTLPSSAEESK